MRKLTILILFFCLYIPPLEYAQSIVNTVHNLSASGPGEVKAISETEVCLFCHTPHNSRPFSPLWNKNDPGNTYILYNSSTVNATIGQPDGSSILCLSCHDGTVALGNLISRTTEVSFTMSLSDPTIRKSNLSTDLADDHPISFEYTPGLAAADGHLKDPVNITWPVNLENGRLQCTSCHDPHKNDNTDFLLASSQYSDLCLSCHQRDQWIFSSHRNSNSTWNGSGTDPWFHTDYNTVTENACENCHNTHNADGKQQLMNYDIEENNCLNCHNGNVATQNISTQLNKPYSHNVYSYFNIHDANESTLVTSLHVECADCHNPHQTTNAPANAPNANGFIKGVKGIDQNGNPVNPISFEYELCYRCHTDSPNMPVGAITRQIEQTNVRLEFSPANPSFHPVTGPGVNSDVPSLISPLTELSFIYCTSCHASDGNGSPAGPHGSIYPSLLKYQYETADQTDESAANYELCYSCHDRNSILNDDSFKEHKKHIQGEKSPCSACHDPHGINNSQGNSTNNSNLINFDINIVSSFNGVIRFEDTGNFSGNCTLKCHGEKHDSENY